MISITGWIRTKRALRRLEGYYRTSKKQITEDPGEIDEDRGELAYHKGRCLGFSYALAQAGRRDLSAPAKEDLLAKYRHDPADGDIDEVISFLRGRGADQVPEGRLFEGARGGSAAGVKFRQGFAEAIDLSCRLLDDAYNYMSFSELLLSLVKKVR